MADNNYFYKPGSDSLNSEAKGVSDNRKSKLTFSSDFNQSSNNINHENVNSRSSMFDDNSLGTDSRIFNNPVNEYAENYNRVVNKAKPSNALKFILIPLISGMVIFFVLVVSVIVGLSNSGSKNVGKFENSNSSDSHKNTSNETVSDSSVKDSAYGSEKKSDDKDVNSSDDEVGSGNIIKKQGRSWYIKGDKVVVYLPSRIYGEGVSSGSSEKSSNNEYTYTYGSDWENIDDDKTDGFSSNWSIELSGDNITCASENSVPPRFYKVDYSSDGYIDSINYSDSTLTKYNYSNGRMNTVVYTYISSSAESKCVYSYGSGGELTRIDNISEHGNSSISYSYSDGQVMSYEYSSDFGVSVKTTNSYDSEGNIVKINKQSNSEDAYVGDINIEYTTLEVPLSVFPYYFFNYYIGYMNRINQAADGQAAVVMGSSGDYSIGASDRNNGNGYYFSGCTFKGSAYKDLKLTMDDVEDFYNFKVRKYK